MVTAGNSCISRGSDVVGSYTYFDTTNSVDENGELTNICLYSDTGESGSFSIKCKVFRLNGSNYDVVHTHASWQTHNGNGAQNFPVSWAVQSGDYVGFSMSETGYENVHRTTGSGSYKYISGDITTSTPTSSWSSGVGIISVYGTGEAVTGDKYVDIATGSDSDSGDTWGSAYLTVKKGLDNLPANDNLHIAFGDYSAQASIDLDQNVNLICEQYGGGGTGTVTLPPTA